MKSANFTLAIIVLLCLNSCNAATDILKAGVLVAIFIVACLFWFASTLKL